MKKQMMEKITKKVKKKEVDLKSNNYGITLISLVISIIVLLILSSISISMINGNNGIIKNAGNAKDAAIIAEEKEIIERAIVQAMGASKYGNLKQSDLQAKMDTDEAIVYEDGDGFIVLFKQKRIYTIDNDGNIGETISNYEAATKKLTTELTNNTFGTEEKPYEINCIEDLVDLSYKVNGIVIDENGAITYTNTRNNFSGKHIVLTKNLNFKLPLSYEDSTRKDYGDINENGEIEELLTELTTGTGWIPIGGNDHGTFGGNFNGNNYEISQLYINNENSNGNSGLFGTASTIENLGVLGNIYCNSNCAGGICSAGCRNIKNCYFSGCIENINKNAWGTGGILGCDTRGLTTKISLCHCSGQVIGRYGYVGGIAGQNGNISSCYNESYVIGKNGNGIGGIVGHYVSGDILSNSYNKGKVEGNNNVGGIVGYRYRSLENCYNIGEIVGNNNVGGIGGYGDWKNDIKITQCYNTGKVNGNGGVGGILGSNCSNYVLTLDKCFNKGEITSTNTASGIAGTLNSSESKVINCYNSGKINGAKIQGIASGSSDNLKLISCYNTGELNSSSMNKYGIANKGVVTNCYYLTNQGSSTENATEVTVEELKNLATTLDKTYTIDDENNTITINENTSQNVWKKDTENKNDGYPIFMWQE